MGKSDETKPKAVKEDLLPHQAMFKDWNWMNTVEFSLYLATFAFFIIYLWVPYVFGRMGLELCYQFADCSQFQGTENYEICRTNPQCVTFVSEEEALFPGGAVDQGDDQLASFRMGLVSLVPLTMIYLLVTRTARYFLGPTHAEDGEEGVEEEGKKKGAVPFGLGVVYALLGVAFLVYLQGAHALFSLLAILTIVVLTQCCVAMGPWGRMALVPLAWIVACCIRVMSEFTKNSLTCTNLAHVLFYNANPRILLDATPHSFPSHSTAPLHSPILSTAQSLDNFHRNLAWWISYPLLMLRLISYALDTAWSNKTSSTSTTTTPSTTPSTPSTSSSSSSSSSKKKTRRNLLKPAKPEPWSYRWRVERSHEEAAYGRWDLILGYILYPPLFIAGPITTFNAWVSHLERPQRTSSPMDLFLYALRYGASLLLLEMFLEYVPVFAALRSRGFLYLDFFEQGRGLFTLMFVAWLKFLIIWRYFRMVTLLDGFDAPENLLRCIVNHVSIEGFWRSWHRSYNQWLVRYLYIPLGGSRAGPLMRLVNMGLTFTFVALWHDFELKLIQWGWVLSFLLIPEVLIGALMARKDAAWIRHTNWWRILAGVGIFLNMLFLLGANALGFLYAVKPDHVFKWINDLFTQGGAYVILPGAFVLYGAVQCMLLVRMWEEDRWGGTLETVGAAIQESTVVGSKWRLPPAQRKVE